MNYKHISVGNNTVTNSECQALCFRPSTGTLNEMGVGWMPYYGWISLWLQPLFQRVAPLSSIETGILVSSGRRSNKHV